MCTCRCLHCTSECAHTHRSHRDTETHQWIKCKQPLQENLLFWLCSWQCQNMSECVRIIQNSCHRFKVQTLLQPSKCLLGLLSKGGIDTVEQAPSPGGILEPIFPYEQGSKDGMYRFSIRPPSLSKICDFLWGAIGSLEERYPLK
jgi:hypothetical protein